ncbi:MAG: methyltransferase [Bifidobacteriaceae bacterium]|nr:methyltransferase [Bifidobacteriaceae bacterium]
MPPGSHYFKSAPLDRGTLRDLQVVIAGRPVTVATAAGVFSASRIDLGTAVLLRTLARLGPMHGLPPAGLLVDLGCGWGPLTLTMASLAPRAQVAAIDVNQAARELTEINADRLGLTNVVTLDPSETAALTSVDAIWSNPPVRIGKAALVELLTDWTARLAPDGQADFVIGRHLGADSIQAQLNQLGHPTDRLASAKGDRVLRTGHPRGAQNP